MPGPKTVTDNRRMSGMQPIFPQFAHSPEGRQIHKEMVITQHQG